MQTILIIICFYHLNLSLQSVLLTRYIFLIVQKNDVSHYK